MRTLIIILAGYALLALCLLSGRWLSGSAGIVIAAQVFIVLWLALAGANMGMGVARAGYTVAEELPIFLLIFALPAATAALAWWKLA